MEKIIRKALMQFLEQHHLLSDAQHGFRSGRTCLTNVLFTLAHWTEARDEGNVVHAIYTDFKKASDCVATKVSCVNCAMLKFVDAFLYGSRAFWLDGPKQCRSGINSPRSNGLAQRLDNLPIADAVAAENASVENRWCQLRDTVRSTALTVLGRAPRQHQDWFDDNDAAIRNLLAEKNRLHKAYVDHPTDDNKAAFYRSRRQLQ
nr:unnamed protein product [Spirometra erinaceieuropaei]